MTQEENFDNALCFQLNNLELASLLGAVCENLAEGRALEYFVEGFQTDSYDGEETPLMVTAHGGKLSCLKVLLDQGANLDKEIENGYTTKDL